MNQTKKTTGTTVALIMVMCLFFLWAISNNLLSPVVKKMMTLFDIDQARAEFVETSYWFAYFLFPIPIAMFMKRFSYKAGIVLGLLIAAAGGLLFLPVTRLHSFPLYLCAFFVVATGMCFLETAANPYVTELGDPATAPRRLNLAQAFNGLGAFIAAMFLSKIILGTENTGSLETEIHTFRMTYAIFAIVLIVIAIIFIFTKLPRIQTETSEKDIHKLISFKVLKRNHLRNGVIAQFFYNGGQTALNSLFLVYCINYVGMSYSQATTFFGFYMLFFLLGRWIGTTLMVKFRPEKMLVVYSVASVLLCVVICVMGGKTAVYAMMGISFFMSIMYPTQFSLAITDLKEDTKSGSAFLVMAIVGNSILPILTAYVQKSMDNHNIAYLIPLVCFVVCGWYGWKGHRVVN
ncbi:MAG TPA: L-fucose:H+ symporter permease [Bacteroidaceae bacterium]|jgi:FHS family L-fucose permease-like MFS transporter|nr:L-fucose:H+ symporter permease [Bacteroidaceae bacterium]MBP8602129.1 L-fucose:H+ symporter permease [Bacteroidaceae bacterium]HOD67821.1 L-fucose:H+ symporter permease [Bacteroidaceae bacterium]HPB03621.1 L-fucose:H+ symporter permease [Bacteroidaceae bacterium]HQL25358.1 L-fucose:H+ symporter permease [Bacteroidaceae bacterium]